MSAAEGRPEVTDLLTLAIADPDRAEASAQRLIASAGAPALLSIAHQSLGIVWRDRGRLPEAMRAMRTSVGLAGQTRDPDRVADARATLGATLAVAGRTAAGLAQLEQAVSTARDPVVRAKALVRRGHVQFFLRSRPEEARVDLEHALECLRGVEEPVWLARTLNLLGMSQMALGDAAEATRAVEEAGVIFEREGQVVESVVTLHNRGTIAHLSGDLPRAMQLYDEAAARYAAVGVETAPLIADHCELLLTAGLAEEAVDLVSGRLEQGSLAATQSAELLFSRATAELALADAAHARASATRARDLFRRQGRTGWAVRAGLAVVLARQQAGESGRRLVSSATSAALELEKDGYEDAGVAWLVAGRLALGARLPDALDLLDRAAAYRTHSSDLVRATGWQAWALRREVEDDRRGVLAACRRGLDALDTHRATLGSSELRALATRHGDELAALALRHAVHRGPRVLLEWSERWRATALTQPPVHPPDDAELAQALAALRDTRRRLAEAQAEGSPTATHLDDERSRLERAIRRRAHHLAGTSAETAHFEAGHFEAGHLVESLDGAAFVELVDIGGVLHALGARSGRVTHVVVGATSDAEQAVAFARFALRQTARGRPSDLAEVGRRLQTTLLGDAVRRLGDGPVVVSPPGRLHATPWSLLPALAGVPVSVAPSGALWLRARSLPVPTGSRVLIAGPGLESGGAELDILAARHPDAVLLRRGTATVERSLEALDGAAVAHVAAHGRFREDSPLFSSLDLDDGPLTVHDFERLDRAPHRIVLSACESGVVAPIGAGEMLGLVSAMLAMGSAGIVSSVAKVNDHATADMMLDVHAAMDEGDDLGHVLLRAREAARGDRVHEATAAAFLAMGV